MKNLKSKVARARQLMASTNSNKALKNLLSQVAQAGLIKNEVAEKYDSLINELITEDERKLQELRKKDKLK